MDRTGNAAKVKVSMLHGTSVLNNAVIDMDMLQ